MSKIRAWAGWWDEGGSIYVYVTAANLRLWKQYWTIENRSDAMTVCWSRRNA